MRIFGVLLIVLGMLWIVICYVGIMMMSRGVDYFHEAFLPSLLGLVIGAIGVGLLMKAGRKR